MKIVFSNLFIAFIRILRNNIHIVMTQTFTVVWLDAYALESDNSFREKLGNAQIFNDSQKCIDYIQTHSNELIYFIVSGSLAQDVVPTIFELDNLMKIFLYCGSVMKYAEWGLDFIEKLLIFDHGDDLLERLWNEIESCLRSKGSEYAPLANEYKKRALRYKQAPCG